MILHSPSLRDLSMETQSFYREVVRLLHGAGVPFLVGGAYALAHYTGIVRHTKDFDVFVRPAHARRALRALAARYRTELTFSHWLGKVFHGEELVDVIFSSGNGLCKVDDEWFAHAQEAAFLGAAVRLCPPEEMIWQKAFICERERYDGADVNHLLLARGPELDWDRLLRRFGAHWRALFSHLVLFGYTYPAEREVVPAGVMDELTRRLREEEAAGAGAAQRSVCRGTLLSRTQYAIDLDEWGFEDGRVAADSMTPDQAFVWTRAGLCEGRN
jgi:hypothetical protein